MQATSSISRSWMPSGTRKSSPSAETWTHPRVEDEIPPKRVLQIGRFRIGLIHGWGSPLDLEDRIRREFENVDCIVYGHSHYPANHIREGILFFNPGTACDRRHAGSNTVGILEVGEDAITGRIIAIDEG